MPPRGLFLISSPAARSLQLALVTSLDLPCSCGYHTVEDNGIGTTSTTLLKIGDGSVDLVKGTLWVE